MSETNIEWAEHVWNPVRGCTPISPGCKNCYAMRDAARKNANPKLPGYKGFAIFNERHESRWTGKLALIPDMLDVPLRRRKSTTYFVNSMSDLFHEDLPDEAIDRVFAVMAMCPQHTFQVLTKRAERMCLFVSGVNSAERFHALNIAAQAVAGSPGYGAVLPTQRDGMVSGGWPLPNVWLGVSCEDRARLSRVDFLRRTPAAIRFLSLEPLLEDLGELELRMINWVIVGGESGPGARPCDLSWIRSIVQQCKAAAVPCFVKQLGSNIRAGNGTSFGWPINTCSGLRCDTTFDPPKISVPDRKGGNEEQWPDYLRIREFPLRKEI